MTVKRFKQTQRFRVNVGEVSFYSTAKQIRNGVGDFIKCNAATQKALDALEYIRSGTGAADQCTSGLAGTWEGLQVQLNVA
jgi:GTP cyclohydrolase III